MDSIFGDHPEVARYVIDAEQGRNRSIRTSLSMALQAMETAHKYLGEAEFQANMACRDRTRQDIEDAYGKLKQVEREIANTRSSVGEGE